MITRHYAVYARKAHSWETEDSPVVSQDGVPLHFVLADIYDTDSLESGKPPLHTPADHIFITYHTVYFEPPLVNWADQRTVQIEKERGILYSKSEQLREEAESLLALEAPKYD